MAKKVEINFQFAAFCSITIYREFPGMGKDFPGMTCRRFPGNFPPGKNREASLILGPNLFFFFFLRLTRQNSLPSLNERKVSAPPPSTPNTLGGANPSGGGPRRSTVVARSPSSAKEVILSWVQDKLNNNPNYPVIILKVWA